MGKLHIVGETNNKDVLYLENLQEESVSPSYSHLLISNSNGKVVKASADGPTTIVTNFRSSQQQTLDQTSTSGQLVRFLPNDSLLNDATSFNSSDSTFSILSDGYYLVSGFVGFNAFRNDLTLATEFVAMNLYFEVSTDGGSSWKQLTGIRNTFVGKSAGIGGSINISPITIYLSANSKIRLIIQRPQISENQTLGTPSGISGHINLPTGQSYSKSVLIMKL